MSAARCPDCGANIVHAEDVDTEKDVPLETFTEGVSQAPRYRYVGHQPHRVKKVVAGAAGDYYPDHRFDCPGHGAGLR